MPKKAVDDVRLVRNNSGPSGAIAYGSKQKPACYDVWQGDRRLGCVVKYSQPSYRKAGRLITGQRGYPVEWRVQLDSEAEKHGVNVQREWRVGYYSRERAIEVLVEWWRGAPPRRVDLQPLDEALVEGIARVCVLAERRFPKGDFPKLFHGFAYLTRVLKLPAWQSDHFLELARKWVRDLEREAGNVRG